MTRLLLYSLMCQKYTDLCKYEIRFENDEMNEHIFNRILPTIGVYITLIENGFTKEKALAVAHEEIQRNSYEYEMIYASPYPPFGEVVDYTENADGTLTLIVDGVWPDYNSDLAFRNTVVVQPFEDGTFRYLSNSIEQIELELPPIAKSQQR